MTIAVVAVHETVEFVDDDDGIVVVGVVVVVDIGTDAVDMADGVFVAARQGRTAGTYFGRENNMHRSAWLV